jgi:ligand-binding SRPBCC domain-containing protein
MSRIQLSTTINAPRERVFDLARSIDLHVSGFESHHHSAVGGVARGLIGVGEQVEWRGKAFGLWWKHRSEITIYDGPQRFRDSMVNGAFKSYEHDHYFAINGGATIMRDVVCFEAPAGPIGKIVDRLLLDRYLYRLIVQRAETIRETAESDRWKQYIPAQA